MQPVRYGAKRAASAGSPPPRAEIPRPARVGHHPRRYVFKRLDMEGFEIMQSHARAILLASGRFDLLLGFRAWVSSRFHDMIDFGQGRTLYFGEPVLSDAV
jgi:hypothetical protein